MVLYIICRYLRVEALNTNQLKITFSIPEKYAAQVQVNAIIKFKVAGYTEEFEAKVYAIEPSIEITTSYK